MTRVETLQEVLAERAQREAELQDKHPWVPIVTNWFIWLALVILVIVAVIAGIRYSIDKRDEAMKRKAGEEAVSAYVTAQNQAAADAYEQSEEKKKADEREANAVLLAKDSGVWKTEAAFKAHCWNVCIRVNSPLYPNSVQAVLAEPEQYAYSNPSAATYSTEKYRWAMEVLVQAETGRLPTYLTPDHIYEEMRNGGNDCVLHTVYKAGPGDDAWKYRE